MKFEGQVQNIELRGIERAAEDNLCNLGAMNEVIGMEYKDGSYVPYVPTRKDHPLVKDIKYIRIHKTSYGDNVLVICNDDRLIWFTKEDWENQSTARNSISEEHDITDAVSIEFVGNMACIQTRDDLKFALFKNDKYAVISQVSDWKLPEVEFRKKQEYEIEEDEFGYGFEVMTTQKSFPYFENRVRTKYYNENGTIDANNYFESNAFRNLVFGSMMKSIGDLRNKGYLVGSSMITYGFRLSNGNIIRAQIPTVIPSQNTLEDSRGNKGYLNVNVVTDGKQNLSNGLIESITHGYQIERRIKNIFIPDEIKEYISSLCIFLSPEMVEYNNLSGEQELDILLKKENTTVQYGHKAHWRRPEADENNWDLGEIDNDFWEFIYERVNTDKQGDKQLGRLYEEYVNKHDGNPPATWDAIKKYKTRIVYRSDLTPSSTAISGHAAFTFSVIGWAKVQTTEEAQVVTDVNIGLSPRSEEKIVEDLRKNPFFYKIEEIPIEKVGEDDNDKWKTIDLENSLGDNLVVRESLPASSFSNERISGELYTYNGRLHVYNLKRKQKYDDTIFSKHIFNHSTTGHKLNCKADAYIAITFKDGRRIVKERRDYACSHNYLPRTGGVSGDLELPILSGYPANNVSSIKIYKRAYSRYTHPQRQGYWDGEKFVHNIRWNNYVWEMDIPIVSYSNGYSAIIENLREGIVIKGERIITNDEPLEFIVPPELNNKEDNFVKVSDANYPLYFPTSYSIGDGDIIGMAKLSTSLSQDSFGRFPLLVFCTDGIYSMSVDTTGDSAYGSSAPFSREVCVNKNSICEIDGMVLFATDKGLCVATQNNVQLFTNHLNGKVRNLPTKALDKGNGLKLYDNAITNDKLVQLEDAISLDDFVGLLAKKDTFVRYVSSKNKIIVYNNNYEYSYFIDIPSQKVTKLPISIRLYDNNFPSECLYKDDVMELLYESDNKNSVPCLMQSRAIKITQDFKSIYKIALRGYFENDQHDFTKGIVHVKFKDNIDAPTLRLSGSNIRWTSNDLLRTITIPVEPPPYAGRSFQKSFIFDGILNQLTFKEAFRQSGLPLAYEQAYKLTFYDDVSKQKNNTNKEVASWGVSDIQHTQIETTGTLVVKFNEGYDSEDITLVGKRYERKMTFDGEITSENDFMDKFLTTMIEVGKTEDNQPILEPLYKALTLDKIAYKIDFYHDVSSEKDVMNDDVDELSFKNIKHYNTEGGNPYVQVTVRATISDELKNRYNVTENYSSSAMFIIEISQEVVDEDYYIKTQCLGKDYEFISAITGDTVYINGNEIWNRPSNMETSFTVLEKKSNAFTQADIYVRFKNDIQKSYAGKEYVVVVKYDEVLSMERLIDKVYENLTYGSITVGVDTRTVTLADAVDVISDGEKYHLDAKEGVELYIGVRDENDELIEPIFQYGGVTEGTIYVTYKTADEMGIPENSLNIKPYYGRTFYKKLYLNGYIVDSEEFIEELYKVYNKKNTFILHEQDKIIIDNSLIFNEDGTVNYTLLEYLRFSGLVSTDNQEKFAGLYALGSLDGKTWQIIGAKEKSLNKPFHDFGVETYRVGIKYMMIIFVGELSSGSHIDAIQLTANAKYNNKLK